MTKENLDPNWLGGESEDDEIYKENILDHFKNPHNFGNLKEYTIKQRKNNPLCGDVVEIYAKLEDNKIVEVKFAGNGCAISMAASSMLTDFIKGKSLEEIKNLSGKDVLKLLNIRLGVVRMKCGMLCLNAILEGVHNLEEKNESAES